MSYDRILQVENRLATAVCQYTGDIGVVCPSQKRHGIFTIGAQDNLDYIPSNTTATESIHGTSITLFQFSISSSEEQNINVLTLTQAVYKNKFQLPEDYTTVPAVVLHKASTIIPKPNTTGFTTFSGHLEVAEMLARVEHAAKLTLDNGETIAWTSYHANNQEVTDDSYITPTQLMPLFYEKAATTDMIKHGMSVQRKATEFLNPGQIPVTAFDAPLYALAKVV